MDSFFVLKLVQILIKFERNRYKNMQIKKIATISLGVLLLAPVISLVEPQSFQIVQAAKKSKTKTKKAKYIKAKLTMPKGYTIKALKAAYAGHPSKSFINASMKGMQDNSFSRLSAGESAKDNKTKIRLDSLTDSQRKELTDYALRLINDARKQLGLRPWIYSQGAEKLALDIATEYQANSKSIKDGGHYVAGIVRASKKNGLDLDDNYVEDMAGFYSASSSMTMTKMKKNIYFGLKQMIFGYTGSGEASRNKRSYYREWEHAGDLFNTQNSRHDGDFDYFGFSVSRAGNVYSMHFIGVPSYAVNNPQYNKAFKI